MIRSLALVLMSTLALASCGGSEDEPTIIHRRDRTVIEGEITSITDTSLLVRARNGYRYDLHWSTLQYVSVPPSDHNYTGLIVGAVVGALPGYLMGRSSRDVPIGAGVLTLGGSIALGWLGDNLSNQNIEIDISSAADLKKVSAHLP